VLGAKYEVEAVLGRGGMGTVLAARHLELGHRVAIKVLNPELARDSVAVQRFLREARAMARIASDHVCRVFDVGEQPSGAPYMVMELLEGPSLRALPKPMAVTAAVDFARQVCEGLIEAHALGIVHRDLKPANLLLARRTRGKSIVKVLDFGISKVKNLEICSENLTLTETALGTPLFMAPEQLASSPNVDARADIWALGVCLYQWLTGRMPYEAENLAHLGYLVLSRDPTPPQHYCPNLPTALVQIVLKCLRRDPAERFTSAEELASYLEAVRGTDPGLEPMRPPSTTPPPHTLGTRLQAAEAQTGFAFLGTRGDGGSHHFRSRMRLWGLLGAAIGAGTMCGLGLAVAVSHQTPATATPPAAGRTVMVMPATPSATIPAAAPTPAETPKAIEVPQASEPATGPRAAPPRVPPRTAAPRARPAETPLQPPPAPPDSASPEAKPTRRPIAQERF
jgi:serine/threonine-protein kinase